MSETQETEGTGEVAKARRVEPLPTLRVTEGRSSGTVIRLERDSATLGRRANNDYVLADSSVSRVHARITKESGSLFVTDLGSSGGTQVNGDVIEGAKVISHGDTVTFGSVTMVLEDPTQIDTDEDPTEVLEVPEVETGPELSPRQQQVLQLIAEGMTNGEIGEELGITERTVKAYASELYSKLDVSNRAGAVAQAVKHGLL